MQKMVAMTRQFEQQTEELRAELNASRKDEQEETVGRAEAVVQQGEEDKQETNVRDGGNVAEGDFIEEDGGNDSDGETDAGNFGSPDDIFTSRRSLV